MIMGAPFFESRFISLYCGREKMVDSRSHALDRASSLGQICVCVLRCRHHLSTAGAYIYIFIYIYIYINTFVTLELNNNTKIANRILFFSGMGETEISVAKGIYFFPNYYYYSFLEGHQNAAPSKQIAGTLGR